MALLSDTDILALLSPSSRDGFKEATQQGSWVDSQNRLLIFPFRDELLTPIGYDLTVGDIYLSLSKKAKFKLRSDGQLIIQPNETVLVITEEYLGLPKNKAIGGLIESKVSIRVNSQLSVFVVSSLQVCRKALHTSHNGGRRDDNRSILAFPRQVDQAPDGVDGPPVLVDVWKDRGGL